jgi:hypothetical protein
LGGFRKARALRGAVDLKVQKRGVYSEIVVPELRDYELVVLN